MSNEQFHVIREKIYQQIKKTNLFYSSIFCEDYSTLDDEDQIFLIGCILGDFGYDLKDLVDICVEELASGCCGKG